jgi:hypothetical protein
MRLRVVHFAFSMRCAGESRRPAFSLKGNRVDANTQAAGAVAGSQPVGRHSDKNSSYLGHLSGTDTVTKPGRWLCCVGPSPWLCQRHGWCFIIALAIGVTVG